VVANVGWWWALADRAGWWKGATAGLLNGANRVGKAVTWKAYVNPKLSRTFRTAAEPGKIHGAVIRADDKKSEALRHFE